MAEHDDRSDEKTPDVQERLALPLLLPAGVFLFALLVIYGLSRIYLELNTIDIGAVTMATPAALGVALAILGIAWYLATRRRVTSLQIASVSAIAIALLTGGAIWAAVHDEGEPEHVVGSETPPGDETPVAPGAIQIALIDPDWAVEAEPASASAGSITFAVSNDGNIVHNLRLIRTDLAPDQLPIDETGFAVDEGQVDVVGRLTELSPGESGQVSVDLEAGSYVVICNVPTHYDVGMRTAFTVE